MSTRVNFRNLRWLALLAIIVLSVTACGNQHTSASEEVDNAEQEEKGFFERVTERLTQPEETVQAGTKVQVRLDHGISTDSNQSGDQFTARLDNDLTVDGKLLAPAGSVVTGVLPEVDDSDRVKGRAVMSLALKSIMVDGEEYSLETHPITVEAEGTKKKDAAAIAGSAAVGTVIGAITGGKKGAAIGAGVGGGAGTGYVLATKGEEVEFGPETRFAFTLSESLTLPVIE